jgi:hypothetical protein
MKLTPNDFFHDHVEYKQFDLNFLYLKHKDMVPDVRNPQYIHDVLVMTKHDKSSCGGYGEDRKDVWAETYMKQSGRFTHLGVDMNRKYQTRVISPFDANIVDRFTDTDTQIGWGGRLILENNGRFLVLAHLDPDSMTTEKFVEKGRRLGVIGTWPTNGNTFEHLHIQVINHQNFSDFDGYGYVDELVDNPDPFNVEFD